MSARSSPSANPNDSTEANTTSPLPNAVMSVVIQRACKLRMVYLMGITTQTTFLSPATTDMRDARRAGPMPLTSPMAADNATPCRRIVAAIQSRGTY